MLDIVGGSAVLGSMLGHARPRCFVGRSIGLACGRVQVDGQGRVVWSGPSGPGMGQQLAAHAVELTDMPPSKAAQEDPRVDGALTVRPRARDVPLVRITSASSVQSPSASSFCRRCWLCLLHGPGPGVGQPVGAGQGAGRGWPEGVARHWRQGGGRQRRFGCDLDGGVAASIGRYFSSTGLLLQNHCPRFKGAPFGHFRTLTRRLPTVDSGLSVRASRGAQTPVAAGCNSAALALPSLGVSCIWADDCESTQSGRGYAR